MSTLSPRRQRSDARHNAQAIMDAAKHVFAERPEAGLADVAKAAGISRQTLYAHFPSRDALISALYDQATVQVTAALDAADLESGPADAALVRMLETAWRAFDTDPFLLHLAAPPVSAEQDAERHAPIMERLQAVIQRGQREGDIDAALSVTWILRSIMALGHVAGEEVQSKRMTPAEAIDALRISIPRLVRPATPPSAD